MTALLEFSNRIYSDWEHLADYFKVSRPARAGFVRGHEPQYLLEWLEARQKLSELPQALTAIGRADLVSLAQQILDPKPDPSHPPLVPPQPTPSKTYLPPTPPVAASPSVSPQEISMLSTNAASPVQENTLVSDLRKQIEKKQVIAIVGAGVSIGATDCEPVASWTGLLKHGIQQCRALDPTLTDDWQSRCEADAQSSDIEDLLSVAEKISRKLGAPSGGEFRRWLRETVGQLQPSHPEVINTLHDLSVPLATTNYDGLLEAVTKFTPVTWLETAEVERVLRGEEHGILHLHGYWKKPESVVLGIRSYEDVLHGQHNQSVLKTLFLTKTVLFVGFGAGLNDPNFGALLSWVKQTLSSSEHRHYRLMLNSEANNYKRTPEDRIFPLGYGKNHSDLVPFLRSLIHRTDSTSAITTESSPSIHPATQPQVIPLGPLPKKLPTIKEIRDAEIVWETPLERVREYVFNNKSVVALGSRKGGLSCFQKQLMAYLQQEFPDRDLVHASVSPLPGQSPDAFLADFNNKVPALTPSKRPLIACITGWSKDEGQDMDSAGKHNQALGKTLRAYIDGNAKRSFSMVALGGYPLFLMTYRGDAGSSPFNVAEKVHVQDWTEAQIHQLMQKIAPGLWSENDAKQALACTGGHPYIVKKLLEEWVRQPDQSWAKPEQALQQNEEVQSYFGALLAKIKKHPETRETLQECSKSENGIPYMPFDPDNRGNYLYYSGLVRKEGNRLKIRCETARDVIQPYLS